MEHKCEHYPFEMEKIDWALAEASIHGQPRTEPFRCCPWCGAPLLPDGNIQPAGAGQPEDGADSARRHRPRLRMKPLKRTR